MNQFSTAQPLYAELGIVTFPVNEQKQPAIRNFLKVGPRASEKLASSKKLRSASAFAFATDRRNGITVLDVDTTDENVLADALDRHGQTQIIVRSGSGKFHAYYRYNGERRKIRPWPKREIDLLGAGGYVVAPPSRIASGEYHFIQGSLDDIKRLPVLRNLGLKATPGKGSVTEGQRNDSLWRHCMKQAHHVDDFDALLDVARTFNEFRCQPPLNDHEVFSTTQSAWNYTAEGRNWFGQHGVFLSRSEVNEMIGKAQDELILLTFLRANQGPNATFMCTNTLVDKFGWGRKRLSAARRRLIELGHMIPQRQAGRGHAALYRWSK